MTLPGALDTVAFNAYCEQLWRESVNERDIIVLDNLTAHRASRIEEIIREGGGGRVFWLSPYSPIEKMWSRVEKLFAASQSQNTRKIGSSHCGRLKTDNGKRLSGMVQKLRLSSRA